MKYKCSLPIATTQNAEKSGLNLEWSLFRGVFDTRNEASVLDALVVIGRRLLFGGEGMLLLGGSTVKHRGHNS